MASSRFDTLLPKAARELIKKEVSEALVKYLKGQPFWYGSWFRLKEEFHLHVIKGYYSEKAQIQKWVTDQVDQINPKDYIAVSNHDQTT